MGTCGGKTYCGRDAIKLVREGCCANNARTERMARTCDLRGNVPGESLTPAFRLIHELRNHLSVGAIMGRSWRAQTARKIGGNQMPSHQHIAAFFQDSRHAVKQKDFALFSECHSRSLDAGRGSVDHLPSGSDHGRGSIRSLANGHGLITSRRSWAKRLSPCQYGECGLPRHL